MSVPSFSRRTLLVLTLAAACWGIGTVVSKRAVAELPPITLLSIQLAVSLLALASVMRWRGLPLRDRAAAPILGRLGMLNPGLAYALSLLGLVYITASLAVLLWAMEPLLILFLAGWFLNERMRRSLVAASLIALAGVVLVIYQPAGEVSWLGIALAVAGVVCCASYSVATRRWLPTSDSTLQLVVAQEAYALGFALALVAAVSALGPAVWPSTVTPEALVSAAISGLLYYGLAYWLYLSGLRSIEAPVAAISFYLIPIFGVAGGFILLGERLEPGQWAGALTVVAALLWIAWRSSEAAPARAASLAEPT
jgi:probable blue pigment (indigoidine) exporter